MSAPPPRLVCRCLGVSSLRIERVVRARRLEDVAAVTKAVRAGGACGTCHPEIEEILADVHGREVDPGERLENRLVCASETRARVEGCAASLLEPRLAGRGVGIEIVDVRGLEVRVRLPGGGEADRAFVEERLRRYVCEDLCVKREE